MEQQRALWQRSASGEWQVGGGSSLISAPSTRAQQALQRGQSAGLWLRRLGADAAVFHRLLVVLHRFRGRQGAFLLACSQCMPLRAQAESWPPEPCRAAAQPADSWLLLPFVQTCRGSCAASTCHESCSASKQIGPA